MPSELELALIWVLAGSFLGSDSQDEAVQKAMQQLQGTWRCEFLEQNGERAKTRDVEARNIFFGGNTLLVRDGATVVQAGTVQLDPSKNPAPLNLSVIQGQGKGKTLLGLYEWKDNTLRLCWDTTGDRRPTELKAGIANSQVTLAEYKRPSTTAEKPLEIAGTYKSESRSIDGNKHEAETVIERHGDAYRVTWKMNGIVGYVGTGIRKANILSVSWASQGQAGISVYQILPGPKLVGDYTLLGGIGTLIQETLTVQQKPD